MKGILLWSLFSTAVTKQIEEILFPYNYNYFAFKQFYGTLKTAEHIIKEVKLMNKIFFLTSPYYTIACCTELIN